VSCVFPEVKSNVTLAVPWERALKAIVRRVPCPVYEEPPDATWENCICPCVAKLFERVSGIRVPAVALCT